jgi:hypothetical protein
LHLQESSGIRSGNHYDIVFVRSKVLYHLFNDGEKATDFKGNPLQLGGTEVIISNGKILPELVATLKA